MIKVEVRKDSSYLIKKEKIVETLQSALKKNDPSSDLYVSVAIVDEKKMKDIARMFLGESGVVHNVLTFTANETRDAFINPPDSLQDLGEIVICYEKAESEAEEEGVSVDERILELVEHGAEHLIGIHHD